MPTSTQSSAKGTRSWRFRLNLGAAAVAVLAAALIGAFGTSSPATAHPSDGQPCWCHKPQETSKLSLTVSTSKAQPGQKVTVTATWTAPAAKGTTRFRLKYLGDKTHKGGVSAAKTVTVK